jgi:ketosteroid isomerase-like protein
VTAEEVLRQTESFSRALQQHDFAVLEAIYSDRYMLVRPDGSVLNKEQVLNDSIEHKMAFHPIELRGAAVRLFGSTAILTSETTILSSRDGKHRYRHVRIVAVYAQEGEAIRLVHFQATQVSY